MQRHPAPSPRTRTRGLAFAAALTAAGALVGAACGDDDSDEAKGDTVALSTWVDRFDRVCVAVDEELTEEMSDAEFAAFTTGAITVMRTFPLPDDEADTASALLDDMARFTEPDLSDTEIEAIDQRVLENMTQLGISDECVGGVDG